MCLIFAKKYEKFQIFILELFLPYFPRQGRLRMGSKSILDSENLTFERAGFVFRVSSIFLQVYQQVLESAVCSDLPNASPYRISRWRPVAHEVPKGEFLSDFVNRNSNKRIEYCSEMLESVLTSCPVIKHHSAPQQTSNSDKVERLLFPRGPDQRVCGCPVIWNNTANHIDS